MQSNRIQFLLLLVVGFFTVAQQNQSQQSSHSKLQNWNLDEQSESLNSATPVEDIDLSSIGTIAGEQHANNDSPRNVWSTE